MHDSEGFLAASFQDVRVLYQWVGLCQDGKEPRSLSCCLGCVSSYPTVEQAFFVSTQLKTRVHSKTVHPKENGHRLGLVKQMQQLSSVEISKLKCLALSVQSPKKWFLLFKKRKEPARHHKATPKVGCNLPMVWLHVGHQARGLMHLVCALGGCNAVATAASCKTGERGVPEPPLAPAHSGPAEYPSGPMCQKTTVCSSFPTHNSKLKQYQSSKYV